MHMSFDHFYFTTCLPTNISVCYPTASPLVWSQRFLSDHQSVTTGFYHRMFCLATFMSLLTTVVLSSIWSQGSYVNSGWLLGLVKQISVWLQYVPPDLITQISILCRYSNFLSDRNRASTQSGRGKSSALFTTVSPFCLSWQISVRLQISPAVWSHRFLSNHHGATYSILHLIGLTFACLQRFHLCSDRTAFWLPSRKPACAQPPQMVCDHHWVATCLIARFTHKGEDISAIIVSWSDWSEIVRLVNYAQYDHPCQNHCLLNRPNQSDPLPVSYISAINMF